MNWLLLAVVLTLAFFIVRGYRRGLLRMIYSMVAWIVMFVLVSWAAPYVNDFLVENTSLDERISAYCEEKIQEKVQEKINSNVQDAMGQSQNLNDLGIKLPDSVLKNITEKTAGATGDLLDATGLCTIAEKELTAFALNGISFFATMGIAMIFLHLISRTIGVVSRIPVVRGVNRYLGMVMGAISGMMVVWIAFYVIAICSTSQIGNCLLSYIYESTFLNYLYKNNLVVTMVMLFL